MEEPARYAVLIGIDHYKEKPLKGAVRDVQAMKLHLETTGTIDIRMFTSMAQDPSKPSGCVTSWPTNDNVKNALGDITKLANPGDSVYIHFSGHGTREEPSEKSCNECTGDLALVLLSHGRTASVEYFYGRSLAHFLNAMVNKGLKVTLVLDCCFSASVYRTDPSIRFLPYNYDIGAMSISQTRVVDNKRDSSVNRDASMRPNWLTDPDKYSILAACGPHELAREIRFSDGLMHGALSYLLLASLKANNTFDKNMNDIYELLRADFRRHELSQNPVLYGNKLQVFLGHNDIDFSPASVMVIREKNGSLQMLAGQAQGVSNGDQFVLYESSLPILSVYEGARIARVTYARAFTSDLEQSEVYLINSQTRWKAESRFQHSLRNFTVQLANELPRLNELLASLQKRSLSVYTDIEKQSFSFSVTLSKDQEYEIHAGQSQTDMNLPVVLQRHTSAESIASCLEHIARFNLIKDMQNLAPISDFKKCFDVYMLVAGTEFRPDCRIDAIQDTEAELVIINRSSQELYVFIFDLGPFWQAENIYRGTYGVVTPKEDGGSPGSLRKKLKMIIPQRLKEQGHKWCDDIIKTFITSHPTSFDFLELPKLGEPSMERATERCPHNSGCVREDWIAVNFPIRTSFSE